METIGLMKSDKNLQKTSQKRAVSLGNGNVYEPIYEFKTKTKKLRLKKIN